jgi:hypothetical protein
VEAATSAVPAEPSPARLGSPYRNGKRKEGKRRDRSNAQIFRHRNLPMSWASRLPGTLFRTTRCRNGCSAQGGRNPATPSAAGSCCLATTVGRQYWNRQLALGLIRRHANCRFQLRSRQLEKTAFKRLLLSMSALGQKQTFAAHKPMSALCQ